MRPDVHTLAPLLAKVSRSFGLSIRLLPNRLRPPIALGYLLARATDTVADCAQASSTERRQLLRHMRQALLEPLGAAAPITTETLQNWALRVKDVHEATLIMQWPVCLQILQTLPDGQQRLLRGVLAAITEGQIWDLDVPQQPGPGVPDGQSLERYTWLVAGSVGEFWTEVCASQPRPWHDETTVPMVQLGAAYGQGLQWLNIVRDCGQDLRAGRCYWPNPDLQAAGLDAQRLCRAAQSQDRTTLQSLLPLLQNKYPAIEKQLHQGLQYSQALHSRRLRLASALPCLIGIRTLRRLQHSGVQVLLENVRIPRSEVRRLLLGLLLRGVSRSALQAAWNQGARRL